MKYIGQQIIRIKRQEVAIIGLGMLVMGILVGFGIGWGIAN